MDINLELVKRIISSDDLCDKANSLQYSDNYKKQIKEYILLLVSDSANINSNMDVINRYLRKFVINQGVSKEEIFFDDVLLKLYSLKVKDSEFLEILDSFNFYGVKEILVQKYNQIITNKVKVNSSEIIRMLTFYSSVCDNYIFPNDYVDYFTYQIFNNNCVLGHDLVIYFYSQFANSFSNSKGLSISFEVHDTVVLSDPYYDNKKNKIIIYSQNINDSVDVNVLADIFYQIKYIYLLHSINDPKNNNYTYDQLCLVKEICVISVIGEDCFEKNYFDVSFKRHLRLEANGTVKSYFKKLGLSITVNGTDSIFIDRSYDDDTDGIVSIDILFDQVLKRENPNLLKELIKNYPILGSEYKSYNKKSLLNLLLDIYNNRKLLNSLNKDLEWYSSKSDCVDRDIVNSKIEKLKYKIAVCSSYINVMSMIINNSIFSSDDLVRSISDLITYSTSNSLIQNDICSILMNVIPKKIESLCLSRSDGYKENFKKKVIKCYLDSMSLIKHDLDTVYFMRVYSSLEVCIQSFNK